jgi:hypothetical protein
VAKTLVKTLSNFDMNFPPPSVDISKIKID